MISILSIVFNGRGTAPVAKFGSTAATSLSLALALALVMAMASQPVSAQTRQMYRYTNDEGHLVVGYQVPPEAVANGYEILSGTGALLSVVPRTLDKDERTGRSTLEREAKEEQARLQRWDESLLLRYSTIEDIEAARDRELRDLRIRVSILKGKQRSLKQQVENYQALAANQERLGYSVDPQHLTAIDDLQAEMASTERAVIDRQAEIASVESDYQKDVDRFATLLDIVEMRKMMSASDG